MTTNTRLMMVDLLLKMNREELRKAAKERDIPRGRSATDTANNLIDAGVVILHQSIAFTPRIPENYCRKHDLFDCYLCNDASIPLSGAKLIPWENNHTEGSEPTAGD